MVARPGHPSGDSWWRRELQQDDRSATPSGSAVSLPELSAASDPMPELQEFLSVELDPADEKLRSCVGCIAVIVMWLAVSFVVGWLSVRY